MYIHIWKCIDMSIHFWKLECINMYVHGIYMVIHLKVSTCCSDVYVHVYTRLYSTHINMYIPMKGYHVHNSICMFDTYFLFTYMYVKVSWFTADAWWCSVYRCLHTLHECTDIIELCTYTGVSFWFQLFFCPAGWPIGRDWLLPGVTPIQVRAHFNQHQPLVFLPPHPPAFLAGLGADSATAGAAAGSTLPAGEQQLPRWRGEQPLPLLLPALLLPALLLQHMRPWCRPRPWALFQRPLRPWFVTWQSWSWGNRWRPELPWSSGLMSLFYAVRTACNCYLKESGFILEYTSTITLLCWSACAFMLSSK